MVCCFFTQDWIKILAVKGSIKRIMDAIVFLKIVCDSEYKVIADGKPEK
jgi:hypothetical protein